MNLFFWNLKGNDNSALIRQALVERDVDVATFAEHGGVNFDVLCCGGSGFPYRPVDPIDGPGKVRMLVREGLEVSGVFGQGRYMLATVAGAGWKVNLVAIHLQDCRNDSDGTAREETARHIVANLREQERESGCFSSVVIGDFNVQPFSRELTRATAFNATLFRGVASRLGVKQVDGYSYPFMYNPTLEFFSEAGGNCGSFYSASRPDTFYWHCLDQAIASPSLADAVAEYVYVREIGGASLMGPVAPDQSISDHLPLFIRIEKRDSNE